MAVKIFTNFFEPATAAGGPVVSIKRLAQRFDGEVFELICGDTDRDGRRFKEEEKVLTAARFRNCEIKYVSPVSLQYVLLLLSMLGRSTRHTIYCQSFFSLFYTILPVLVAGRKQRFVIAPRGELMSGAVLQKRFKKYAYITLFKLLERLKTVEFHSTSDVETASIQSIFRSKIIFASNIPPPPGSSLPAVAVRPKKFFFLSRLVPKKNLRFAIEVFQALGHPYHLDIFGPEEDQSYVQCCKDFAQTESITNISFKGALNPERFDQVLTGYSAMIFPTLGENFGHVVAEALSMGVPVLASPNTPWSESEGVTECELVVSVWVAAIASNRFFESVEVRERYEQFYKKSDFGSYDAIFGRD